MKNFKNISLALSLVAALSACGSNSTQDQLLSSTSNNSASATPTPSAGNIYNLPAAYQNQVQLSGNNGGAFSKSYNFSTSRKLRVKVEALSAPNLTVDGYTNWVFPYGCMRVTVVVNGSTRQTSLLRVSGITASGECASSASSEILDFSNVTTGSGSVSVTFTNPSYDNCRYYSSPMAYGCSISAVWQNHQVRFNASVETDGTYME